MNDEFAREMQEDLRNEQLRALWRKYGKILVSSISTVLFIAVAVTLYKSYNESKAEERTAQLATAIEELEAKKYKEADAKFAALIEQGKDGTKALAVFKRAKGLMETNEPIKAFEVYSVLIKDTSIDMGLRDYAAIQAAIIALNNRTTVKSDFSFLSDATATERPYSRLARELRAIYLLSENKTEEARKILSDIKQEVGTSPGQRDRVNGMLAMLPAAEEKAK